MGRAGLRGTRRNREQIFTQIGNMNALLIYKPTCSPACPPGQTHIKTTIQSNEVVRGTMCTRYSGSQKLPALRLMLHHYYFFRSPVTWLPEEFSKPFYCTQPLQTLNTQQPCRLQLVTLSPQPGPLSRC